VPAVETMETPVLARLSLYLVAAVTCGIAARNLSRGPARIWWSLTILMLALAVNAPLHLELPAGRLLITGLEALGLQDLTRDQQVLAAIAIGAVGLVAAGSGLALITRWQGWPLGMAIAGLALIGTAIALRAASLHDMDRLLSRPVLLILNPRQAIVLLGVTLVIVGAIGRMRTRLNETPFFPDEESPS
ncbi:MAG: hypothetical protein R3336_10050, partial [Phycisphaeraceae bacterium]|nr:hypothetical protein [Phycisphaeraceae bacterium]